MNENKVNEDHLNGLNPAQKEAVLHTEGPLLIFAGAGAGKTKTLTCRIMHLIKNGVEPKQILAITFTNKAAKEMRDRVLGAIEKERGLAGIFPGEKPFISTFHSLGVHILKENSREIGLIRNFSIFDKSDSQRVVKEIVKEMGLDPKQHEPRKIKSAISKAKGDFITLVNYRGEVKSSFQSIVALIWAGYEERLKKEKGLDFDDLLLEAVLILRKFPEIKNKYQERWQYVHIDEYQDTNEVQYEMTKLLVGPKENICVVGDTDQNIYSWRGANIKNMLHFEKDYPSVKIVMLEQNYRSTKNIIEAANSIIEKNQYRVPKTLFTENVLGEQIIVCEAYDEDAEARYVANEIDELLKIHQSEDIAILYRANFQSRVLEEALLNRQIPYQVLGVKFFDRREIKDLLAYLKASLNQESLTDIKRIINTPTRGIGKVTLTKLLSGQMNDLPATMQIKINKFYTLLEEIKIYTESHKPSEVIKFILEESGLEKALANGTNEDLEKLENMKELVTLSIKYDLEENGLEKLLEDASLSSDQDTLIPSDKDKKKGVRLMTVHSSKGLEFKYVFVTGLEQDLFPHARTGSGTREDKEEERRLFYVALTRAERKLYLTYATLRTIFGMKQVNSPSEFIYDIPVHLTEFTQAHAGSGEKIVYL